MSFFNYQVKEEETPPEPKPEEKIDPRMVIIDGTNLVKLVEDNPEIPEGKTDVGIFQLDVWEPMNYDIKTGEMK